MTTTSRLGPSQPKDDKFVCIADSTGAFESFIDSALKMSRSFHRLLCKQKNSQKEVVLEGFTKQFKYLLKRNDISKDRNASVPQDVLDRAEDALNTLKKAFLAENKDEVHEDNRSKGTLLSSQAT